MRREEDPYGVSGIGPNNFSNLRLIVNLLSSFLKIKTYSVTEHSEPKQGCPEGLSIGGEEGVG